MIQTRLNRVCQTAFEPHLDMNVVRTGLKASAVAVFLDSGFEPHVEEREIPLTHLVRMGATPAAGPKSPPELGPAHFGLVCGIVRLGFSYGRTPPLTLSPSRKGENDKTHERRNIAPPEGLSEKVCDPRSSRFIFCGPGLRLRRRPGQKLLSFRVWLRRFSSQPI